MYVCCIVDFNGFIIAVHVLYGAFLLYSKILTICLIEISANGSVVYRIKYFPKFSNICIANHMRFQSFIKISHLFDCLRFFIMKYERLVLDILFFFKD